MTFCKADEPNVKKAFSIFNLEETLFDV